jgi:ADP-ribosylglycohydrolase
LDGFAQRSNTITNIFIFYDMIKNNYNHPMYLAPEQSSDDTGMCIVLFTGLIVALSVGIMIGLWIATNVQ